MRLIEMYPSKAPADLRIGLVAIRPGTGEILALYGGRDYLERQLNDATQSIAQAGSTFIAVVENFIWLSCVIKCLW